MQWTKKRIVVTLSVLLAVAAGSAYVLAPRWYGVGVYRASDKPAIVAMLKEDYYLMVDEVSIPDFPIDYTFDHRAAGLEEPDDSLHIFVYRRHGKPVGFTTYHHEQGCRARIQFLAVAKGYRGHGYGKALLDALMQDAVRRGYCEINLVARTSNTGAHKLYEKCGFHKTTEEGGFVGFERKLI